MTRAIMLQGTGSNVGKSVLCAGLCRLFARRGLRVRPFKPQNMSNNAAVTADGGEIGRAQALQARACGVPPSLHMNPVLLKPESEVGSQVVVQGRVVGRARGAEYAAMKAGLMPAVLESFRAVSAEADLVIVEGAGSASEVNLRANDIANMGFAAAADIPVLLVADIDRGGVIASVVGTHALLPAEERARVRGVMTNRFRGDPALFASGEAIMAERTGWPSLGVVPWFAEARRLPAEDSVDLESRSGGGQGLRIVVPRLPRIANFDDLDPLAQEPGVSVEIVPLDHPLPARADLVILPGSKATLDDLKALRSAGWDIDLTAHVRRGGHLLGLCGGYQMLGRTLSDPDGLEGPAETVPGLGLLDIETVMTPAKTLASVTARHAETGLPVRGYEMHIGRTEGADRTRPYLDIAGRGEGACSSDGRIGGTYVHGLFASDAFRSAYLAQFGAGSDLAYEATVEATLDALADHLEACLDIAAIARIAGLEERG
ncbi:MAG: cobyric acid synthase [Pseudomonadota bacterium]